MLVIDPEAVLTTVNSFKPFSKAENSGFSQAFLSYPSVRDLTNKRMAKQSNIANN